MFTRILISFLFFLMSASAFAQNHGKYFDRAIFVLFENTDFVKAMQQPFFKTLADDGALFTNFTALAHPSQANYIALTSGALQHVANDKPIDLDVKNIVDLLEAKGMSWTVYAEDYPGHCFSGATANEYVRKHNPFMSFVNIQSDPARCSHIVNANQFDKDAADGNLASYVFYVPNNKNNGHNTGVTYADRWYESKFGKYIIDDTFMENTILISTFDEDGGSKKNQIYMSIVGSPVKPGSYSADLNLYSLLKLVENNWSLGDLGLEDAQASSVPDIWK